MSQIDSNERRSQAMACFGVVERHGRAKVAIFQFCELFRLRETY